MITVKHGYFHHQDNFEFIDGIFEVANVADTIGYKFVFITNQVGLACGYYSEQQFHLLTTWICNVFLDAGAPIEKFIFRLFIRRKA